jgi:hypothetical protein
MLTLVTSGSTYSFVTGDLDPNFSTVYATASSSNDGSGGGGDDKKNKGDGGSSDKKDQGGGGGSGGDSTSNTGDTGSGTTESPPPSTDSTPTITPDADTGATADQNQGQAQTQEQQQCDTGQHFDANANACVADTVNPTLLENLPPTPPPASPGIGECPGGAQPDESGNCPASPPTATEQNTAPQTLTQQTCADGAAPDANGNCPTSTPTLAPKGVVPANPDGSCPPEMTKIDVRCVGVLPGSTTGPGGGFIQMIPTPPTSPSTSNPSAKPSQASCAAQGATFDPATGMCKASPPFDPSAKPSQASCAAQGATFDPATGGCKSL